MDDIKTEIPRMEYMKEIFGILKNGGFINEICLSHKEKTYYQHLFENKERYRDYFAQLGYDLNWEGHYFYLTEDRVNQAVQSKLKTDIDKYIPMLAILIKFKEDITPGNTFPIHEIQKFFNENEEFRTRLPASDDGLMSTRVSLFIHSVEKEGFLEVGADGATCLVTSSFQYLYEYVSRIKLYVKGSQYDAKNDNMIDGQINTEAIAQAEAENNELIDLLQQNSESEKATFIKKED